jgi:hypothetical protein
MPEFGPSTASWCLTSIQVVGLTSGWLARIGEGSKLQTSAQRLFLLCLAIVGLSMMGAWVVNPRSCLTTAATIGVMVLTATWDFSAGRTTPLEGFTR